MATLQNIQNGVTTGGFGSLALDLSPAYNQFIQGQELEQERRRKVIRQNEELFNSIDLSKLQQADLDGGIQKDYDDYRNLAMSDYGKNFTKHESDKRAAHQTMVNKINTAINVRKANMSMYDDLKPLLPPDQLIKLQEDIKRSSLNPDGTQNVLDPSKYQLKPKDYLSVNKMVFDAIQKNTGKSENLKETVRKDGKYNKLTGSRINVKNALDNLYEDYKNDHKIRESVDNAVAQLNASAPTATPLTAQEYLQSQVENEIRSKQSDRTKELYPDGVYKPGSTEAYIDVNPITPNNYVSHTTVKVDAGGKAAEEALKLYDSAHSSLSRFVMKGGNGDDAAAKVTKILKGASVDGGNISGVEPAMNKAGERGFKVYFNDPLYGREIEPKEYYGGQALRRLGLFHNQRQKSVAAQVVPDKEQSKAEVLRQRNTVRAEKLAPSPKTTETSTIKKSKKISQSTLNLFK